jgi:hypothetical protein
MITLDPAERIALSLIQLGTDSDALTHDIEVGDAAVERIRPIVDGERTLSTINGVENLLDKVHDLRSDGELLRHILLDLENPIIRIHRQLERIQDGLDRELCSPPTFEIELIASQGKNEERY